MTSHASTATTYGVGSASNYGHVKVIDNLTQSSNLSGTALSAYQGKVLKDTLDEKPGKTLAGESVYPASGSAVTAEPGAEIFNDYRARGSGDFLGGNAAQGNVASGYWAHAEGGITTASGDAAHAEGSITTALGNSSHAEGSVSRAVGDYSHAAGRYTIANLCQTAVGKFNLEKAGPDSDNSSTGGSLFIVGSGTGNTQRSNAFRVENGTTGVYGAGSYHSTGADYAEHFEWLDGNPDREDRRGLFVTLDGEKICLAAAQDDYILGVISATPTVVGDSREDEWQGKYLKDVFGELLTETVTIPEEKDEKTGKVITPEHQAKQYILNPEYDAGENYIGREQRAEWAIVGLMGKMVAVDDGNCEVNGYCMPGSGGIAVPADKGYRVMKRLDSTHIQILFK